MFMYYLNNNKIVGVAQECDPQNRKDLYMKFLHMADMHFDAPFTTLANKKDLGDLRRLEQRDALKKVIDYILENKIEYLFIAGDLYEHEYIRKSTIEFINKQFERILDTKIFIVPGNHDPYLKNSVYNEFEFSSNVYVFKDNFEKYENEDIVIYGVGFTEFYMNQNPLEYTQIEESDKLKILLAHLDINGVKDKNGFSYNPITLGKLKELNFDYMALGHIHNTNFKENEKICYSGSTISLGFDELGEHGVIVGNFEKGKLKTDFIKIDNRIFTEYELNVENFNSNEEIIEQINQRKFVENELIKIILVGNRNFEIDINTVEKLITNNNVIKVKDFTKTNIDLEKLSKENTLKGIFVNEVFEKFKSGEIESEEQLNSILQIGLEAME